MIFFRKFSAFMWLLVLLVVQLAVLPNMAVACSPRVFWGPGILKDKPISIAADCSFEDAYVERIRNGPHYTMNKRLGGPVRDYGDGRIAQKITPSTLCARSEMLLFVDCNTGESVLIEGKPDEYDHDRLIKYIQRPHGPISLGPKSTVAGLEQIAKEHDLDLVEDVKAFLAGSNKRDRYDLACGCKLYYPESIGAKN